MLIKLVGHDDFISPLAAIRYIARALEEQLRETTDAGYIADIKAAQTTLWGLEHGLTSARGTIEREAKWILDKIETTRDRLNAAGKEFGRTANLNSLGVLQSQGPAYDVAVALYAERESVAARFLAKTTPFSEYVIQS